MSQSSQSKIQPRTQFELLIVAAAGLTLVYNQRFFAELASAFGVNDNTVVFICAVGLVLFSAHLLCLSIATFVAPMLAKPLIITVVIISAGVAYFSDTFGAIIDQDMIRNVIETDPAEVQALVTPRLLMYLIVYGFIPALCIYLLPIRLQGFGREALDKTKLAAIALVGIAVPMVSFGAEFASLIREYQPVRFYSNPLYPIFSVSKYVTQNFSQDDLKPLEAAQPDAVLMGQASKPRLMIMVVGETARADRFALYGNSRNTNPELAKLENELFVFRNAYACGTSTAISVPCMFSFLNRADYSVAAARRTENVLDVLDRLGVNVVWRDNNSGSKGVADRIRFENYNRPSVNPVCDLECRDVGMLANLQTWFDETAGDKLVVLHQLGNHGPAYAQRYPKDFERFTPACQHNDLSACSITEIVNAYDNALLYTDWFLAQVISLLQDNTSNHSVSMLYVSDHGESLGENNIFLHGLPYAFAPKEQIEIPIFVWLPRNHQINNHQRRGHPTKAVSHDHISFTLLEYFNVVGTDATEQETLFDVLRAGGS
ncbi:MAG: phosphoethanolamine--lipid A transferase [Pseudomonadales bacterium]